MSQVKEENLSFDRMNVVLNSLILQNSKLLDEKKLLEIQIQSLKEENRLLEIELQLSKTLVVNSFTANA